MAAFHAIDELVDVEVEESIEVVETASLQIHKGAAAYEVKKLPFLLPLPPPLPQITYSQVCSVNYLSSTRLLLACLVHICT